MQLVLVLFMCASGLGKVHHDTRIVGGQDSYAGQFPFSVAIYKTTSTGRYICGGTLLSTQWVLTAAQCVEGATSFILQMGANALTGADSNRVTVSTAQFHVHASYNPDNLRNDLGLIKLREAVTLTDYVQPLEFANNTEDIYYTVGSSVISLGWGQTSDTNESLNNILHYVQMAIVHIEECRAFFGSQVTGYMTCADGNYNEGICFGDVGSPLIAKNIDKNSYVLVGIASFFSQQGCESLHPSGYTRSDWYYWWIRNTMSQN